MADTYDVAVVGATGVVGEAMLEILAERKFPVGNLYALLKAMEWMAQEHVDVLNLSLETGENRVLNQALDSAATAGIVLTAAAGNGGADARPAYPAAHHA